MSSREVSKDRQRLRRFLSCLPASKPDFSTPSSVSFSGESPFLSFSTLASQSRLPFLSWQNHLLIRVDRRLDVQAASSRFSCLLHEADRRQTLVVSLLPSLPFFRLVPHEKQTQLSRVQPIGATSALSFITDFLSFSPRNPSTPRDRLFPPN